MNIYKEIPVLKNTAIALGCFDGVHRGHLAVIERLNSRQADGFDRTVFSFSDDLLFKKGAEHIVTFDDKCRLLSSLGISELVLPSFAMIRDFSPEDFFIEILIGRLDAKMIVCGENYRFGKKAAGDCELLKSLCGSYGVDCKVVSPVLYEGGTISSSRIRSALLSGEVEQAADMLGRHFSYCFEVVHGHQLGRELGTPTINQYFPENFLIPAYGVYASVTEVDGRRYSSVTNIGVKPTFGTSTPLSETWIIGYDGDLYGSKVRVYLVRYMREECRFDSIDQLKQAIHRDGDLARSLTGKLVEED